MDVILSNGKMATKRLVLNPKKLREARLAAVNYLRKKGIEVISVIDTGTSVCIYY